MLYTIYANSYSKLPRKLLIRIPTPKLSHPDKPLTGYHVLHYHVLPWITKDPFWLFTLCFGEPVDPVYHKATVGSHMALLRHFFLTQTDRKHDATGVVFIDKLIASLLFFTCPSAVIEI